MSREVWGSGYPADQQAWVYEHRAPRLSQRIGKERAEALNASDIDMAQMGGDGFFVESPVRQTPVLLVNAKQVTIYPQGHEYWSEEPRQWQGRRGAGPVRVEPGPGTSLNFARHWDLPCLLVAFSVHDGKDGLPVEDPPRPDYPRPIFALNAKWCHWPARLQSLGERLRIQTGHWGGWREGEEGMKGWWSRYADVVLALRDES